MPLRRHTERRYLLSEANALLRYVLGERPTSGLTRRYIAAVERWDGGMPVQRPVLVRLLPAALRLFDPVARGGPLRRRIDIAMALADATPQGSQRFYAGGSGGWPLIHLSAVLVLEAVLLPLRLLSGRR